MRLVLPNAVIECGSLFSGTLGFELLWGRVDHPARGERRFRHAAGLGIRREVIEDRDPFFGFVRWSRHIGPLCQAPGEVDSARWTGRRYEFHGLASPLISWVT
jgi:hypothetical protein